MERMGERKREERGRDIVIYLEGEERGGRRERKEDKDEVREWREGGKERWSWRVGEREVRRKK